MAWRSVLIAINQGHAMAWQSWFMSKSPTAKGKGPEHDL